MVERERLLREAVREIAAKCPRLVEQCYWAGTSAVVAPRPRMRYALQKFVSEQDALLLAERLLAWTEDAIREDLKAYPDVDPGAAVAMKDELLAMLKQVERDRP